MAHFLKPQGRGSAGYDVDGKVAPGSVWRMQVPLGGTRDIALWGGAGLTVWSNNPTVVPNNGFGEQPSGELRILTLSGKSLGTSMLEAGQQGNVWTSVQVQVVATQAATTQAHTLSQAGLNFIARHEAFVGHLYNDAAGYATIGYGHLVHRSRVGTNATAEAPFAGGITKAQALSLLSRDAAAHISAVSRAVRVPLTQNKFDALVSFSFNVGAGAMRGSGVVNFVNHGGTPQQIHNAFLQWVRAGHRRLQGLVVRRTDEADLLNNGRY